jgi:hypothetical protein
MKLRRPQASVGLRDPAAVGSVPGDVDSARGIDFAAAGDRFDGPDLCASEAASSGLAAATVACAASGATGAATGVA